MRLAFTSRAVLFLGILMFTFPWTQFTLPRQEGAEILVLQDFALPGYPPLARQILAQGDVVAHLHTQENGAVDSVKIISGHPLLAEHVSAALLKWRFRSLARAVEIDVTVRFTLKGKPTESYSLQEVSGRLPQWVEISTNPPPSAFPGDRKPR
jgi:TonB family protein